MAQETDPYNGPAEAKDSEIDLITKAVRRFKDAFKIIGDWQTEAEEDFAFRAGDQWSAEDKAALEEDGRPVITFNRVEPVIDAVAGLEVTNRQEVRYIPREQGDNAMNEMLTEAGRWARDNCDAEDEESEAFLDAVTCGMGWVESRMDYETNPDGEIVMERRDPLAMVWDVAAVKQNVADRRWQMFIRDIDADEFEDMFDVKVGDVEGKGPWDSEDFKNAIDEIEPHDATRAPFYENDVNPEKTDSEKIRVVHYQWKERDFFYRVQDPVSGQTVRFSKEHFEKAKAIIERRKYKWLKQRGWVYKQAFFAGQTVLEQGEAPCKDDFSFHCITGKRDRNKGTWYGLVRPMKDPNRWSNKFFSETLEIIQSGAKGGLMVEKGATANIRKLENAWADPRAVVELEAGALTNKKVQERQTANYPAGLDRLMTFAVESIPQVTGINMELLGLAGKVQAGVLEAQRKQAGLTILARLFNSLRRYRKEQGRVLMYFLQEYISDGRLIRVLGEKGQQYVPLMKDQTAGEYDTIVDDAPTSPNQKEMVWAVIQELAPMLQATGAIPAELFDYLPIPESLAQAFKEQLRPEPTPEQQHMQQLQMRGAEAEVEKTESEAVKNYAQANKHASEAAEKVIPMPEIEGTQTKTGAKK